VEQPRDFTIAPLPGDDPGAVEELARIYETAIPAAERKPLAALLSDRACQVIVGRAGGRVVGFAIVRTGAAADLLEYMAVASAARGAGLGTDLYLAARALAAGGARPLLIEVDSDREPAPDAAMRSRRKAFYRRLGGREVQGLDYVLPLSAGGAPPRMDLMVDRWAGASVPRAVLQGWLRDIYSNAYGQRPDDPRIIAMVRDLADRVPIV